MKLLYVFILSVCVYLFNLLLFHFKYLLKFPSLAFSSSHLSSHPLLRGCKVSFNSKQSLT